MKTMKSLKKCFTILVIFALFLGIGISTPTAAAKKKVKVKSMSLNYKKKTLMVGKTLKLKATVKPRKAKATIKWTSSNKKVATVSSKGKVKAKKKGTAKITATVKGTKLKKICKITVKAKTSPSKTPPAQTPEQTQKPAPVNNTSTPTITPTPEPVKDTAYIATQDDVKTSLAAAKADSKITTVKIETDEAEEIELPEGDYSGLDLVIEAPKAEVSNHAVFKSITVNQIARDTYTEYAEGNVINVNSPIGRIIITDRAKAKLNILKEASEIVVVVDGSVSGIDVKGKNSTIDISGASEDPIKVDASVVSEIKTSHVLEVNASAKVTLFMYPGAEDTAFYIDNNEVMPNVYGVGSIKVTFGNTGDVQTVIAEYRDEVSGEQQNVSLEGAIVDDDSNDPRKGVSVYLVPYTNNFDETKIEENEYRKTTITDENGKYTIDSIHTGNYIMVVKESGMVTAIQYLVITSRYDGVFQNETLRLFPQEEDHAPGSITGVLSNSVDGKPIEGLTARLRKGKGNTVGSILKKTMSDSEGVYAFEGVEPGYYTVEFVDLRSGQTEGYITTSMNAAVRSGRTDMVSTALTKSVSSSQVRFVLTWGDESSGAPADLDSHLLGPKKEGKGRFHTYFSDQTFKENDVRYADLDYDDITWEGPETTTIYEMISGVYDFYIHDYSNREETKSSALATSDAKVEVYQGTTLMVTYYVPNSEGTVWHVCSYDSTTGTFTQNNEMYYESDSSYVGTDPKDRALVSFEYYLSDLSTVLENLEDNDAKTALKQKYEEYKAYYNGVDTSAVSLENIQKQVSELSELIDKVNDGLNIDSIILDEDSSDYAECYNYDAKVVIYTLSPSDVAIEEVVVPEGAQYELIKGEGGILSAITVTSTDGYAKKYMVSYEFPSEYFYIDEVEGSNVSSWSRDVEYDDDDNIKGYVLNVYTKDGNACDFTVIPEYSDKVQIQYQKDADGTIIGVKFLIGSTERTYRVQYFFDENQLLPSTLNTTDEEEMDWDWDWDYNEEDEKEYYVDVMTDTGEASDFTVVTRVENAQVVYTRDEAAGYVKEFTITLGDRSRTYRVRYSFDQSMLLPSKIVSEDVKDWDWDWTYNEDDEREYYISIETETGESCDFTVALRTDKAEVSYDRENGVIKSVTIKIGENSRTYRVDYLQW